MDYSSLNAPNQDPTSLDTHIKETMGFQTQAQVHDAMEVLTMETRSSVGSLYIPLKVKSNNAI